jgi:valyl-tRNA synthetase
VAFSISTDAAVFVHVKGRVDIDGEITKATKKLDKTKQGIERQLKILNDESYKEKVSKEVQQVEESKLKDLETQRKALEETITQFKALTTE